MSNKHTKQVSVDRYTLLYDQDKIKAADRIEENIMLLAFLRSSDRSASYYKLVNGVVDEYQDQTGINIASSVNQLYSSTDKSYSEELGGIDSYATLLLHMNGANASTTFTDSSFRVNAVTAAGSAQISTAQRVFGTGSGYFEGTTSYLTIPSDQVLTNGSFEIWSGGVAVAPDGWTLTGAGATIAREGTTIKIGTYSAKLTRVGADCSLYQKFDAALGINYWKGRTITYGCWVWASVANRAQIDIKDKSGNSHLSAFHTGDSTWQYLTTTFTVATDATYLYAYVYVLTGDTSAYFDGAVITDNAIANFNFGSSDFTIDCWFYINALPPLNNTEVIIGQYDQINTRWAMRILNISGIYYLNILSQSGTTDLNFYQQLSDITTSKWHHFEVDRNGNDFYLFQNGSLLGAKQTTVVSFPIPEGVVRIGQRGDNSQYVNGYLDELRVSKGIARHTANFTVPTVEYGTGSYNNLTLQSIAFAASTTPKNARLVLYEEDIDSIALNTDLKAYASRDNGITWSQVTLANEGSYSSTRRVLAGVVDISAQPLQSIYNMLYKVQTFNNKGLKLRGAAMNWS